MRPEDIRVSFVVPCYNEESRFKLLRRSFEDFDEKASAPYELILVDDGSTDNTAAVMKAWEREGRLKRAQIRRIHLRPNRGKGNALKAGVIAAEMDWVLTLDADMATEPHQLLKWLQSGLVLEEDTVYIGSRVHDKAEVEARWIRKITGGIYNWVTRIFTPIREKDTQCGFKLYPREMGQEVFGKLKTPGWAHDIEILSRVVREGGRIESWPVHWVHREGAKISVLKDGLKMFKETIKIGRMIQREYKVK